MVIAAEYTQAHFYAINLFDFRYKINNIQQYICVSGKIFLFIWSKESDVKRDPNRNGTKLINDNSKCIPNDKKESKLTLTSPFNLLMSVWFLRPDSARQFIDDRFESDNNEGNQNNNEHNKTMF